MKTKKVISVLMLALYLVATCANALGVLACDCASHHRHDLCCVSPHEGHSHSHHGDDCDRRDCCAHNRSLCSAFCETEGYGTALTAHCECTHRHGEATAYTVESDNENLLKYIRVYAVDAACSLCEACEEASACLRTQFRTVAERVLPAPPVIPSRAPRAPSVKA